MVFIVQLAAAVGTPTALHHHDFRDVLVSVFPASTSLQSFPVSSVLPLLVAVLGKPPLGFRTPLLAVPCPIPSSFLRSSHLANQGPQIFGSLLAGFSDRINTKDKHNGNVPVFAR